MTKVNPKWVHQWTIAATLQVRGLARAGKRAISLATCHLPGARKVECQKTQTLIETLAYGCRWTAVLINKYVLMTFFKATDSRTNFNRK
jgi:hypothetical protein